MAINTEAKGKIVRDLLEKERKRLDVCWKKQVPT